MPSRPHPTASRWVLGAALVMFTPQCNDPADPPAPVTATNRDLRFTLRNMSPHAGHRLEYRVVDEQNDAVVSLGILSRIGTSTQGPLDDSIDTLIVVPGAVPRQGRLRLDFYADLDGTGTYSGIGDVTTNDHAWRIASLDQPAPSVGAVTETSVDVAFSHSINFDDIDGEGAPPQRPGLDAVVRLTGPGDLYGHLVEVRVVERATASTVGLYRFPALDAGQGEVRLEGMVRPGVEYDVEVYADRNGDRAYQPTDAPGGDGGWRVPVTASDAGLDVTIDLAASESAALVRFSYP